MRGHELRSLGFPGVWFVPGCAVTCEVSEPAQQITAPDPVLGRTCPVRDRYGVQDKCRPIENSIEGVLKLFC